MTAKEYLGQAYRIDQRINSKKEQVAALRSLATKATAILSDMPRGNTHTGNDNIIVKIMDFENEIKAEIKSLVGLKHELSKVIQSIPNTEQRVLLELRYLCFKPWEQIAVEMGYSIQHTYRIHTKALKEIYKKIKDESKCD